MPPPVFLFVYNKLIGEERPCQFIQEKDRPCPLMCSMCQLGHFWIYLIAEEGIVDYVIMR